MPMRQAIGWGLIYFGTRHYIGLVANYNFLDPPLLQGSALLIWPGFHGRYLRKNISHLIPSGNKSENKCWHALLWWQTQLCPEEGILLYHSRETLR